MRYVRLALATLLIGVSFGLFVLVIVGSVINVSQCPGDVLRQLSGQWQQIAEEACDQSVHQLVMLALGCVAATIASFFPLRRRVKRADSSIARTPSERR